MAAVGPSGPNCIRRGFADVVGTNTLCRACLLEFCCRIAHGWFCTSIRVWSGPCLCPSSPGGLVRVLAGERLVATPCFCVRQWMRHYIVFVAGTQGCILICTLHNSLNLPFCSLLCACLISEWPLGACRQWEYAEATYKALQTVSGCVQFAVQAGLRVVLIGMPIACPSVPVSLGMPSVLCRLLLSAFADLCSSFHAGPGFCCVCQPGKIQQQSAAQQHNKGHSVSGLNPAHTANGLSSLGAVTACIFSGVHGQA